MTIDVGVGVNMSINRDGGVGSATSSFDSLRMLNRGRGLDANYPLGFRHLPAGVFAVTVQPISAGTANMTLDLPAGTANSGISFEVR